jgi:hypothetical protein
MAPVRRYALFMPILACQSREKSPRRCSGSLKPDAGRVSPVEEHCGIAVQ